MNCRTTDSPALRPRHQRRGSAYLFVLGISMIVTVLGLGTLTLSRITTRTATEGNDWETAGTLAFSAIEQALSSLNAAAAASPTGWRSGYTSGQTVLTQAVSSGGTFSWTIKDETDGNLSADYLRSFRLYGVGKKGNVTRVYSVQVCPGGSALDVLRTAVHTSDSLTFTGNSEAGNGPLSTNSVAKLSGTVDGAIEAASVSGSAAGTQVLTVPAPAKTMPSSTVFDNYAASATSIDYNLISGGKIDKCVISPASNPFGATNPKGIYLITVPSGKKLVLNQCRFVGSLLIKGLGNNALQLDGPVLMEPAFDAMPTLIISAPGSSLVINGSDSWLSESTNSTNFNPASTPYGTESNSNTTDDFPPQYRGVFHIMVGSSGNVNFNNNAYGWGTFIADCPVKTSGQTTFVQNSSYQTNPPVGYASGDVLNVVPGTWKWDAPP